MKKKSQIELFMPINEDISGMHRPNKDVNNLEDSECEPRKSFTDDDSLDDNLKKEALGLFDLPAGAPDGAQNFRSRDSYKEEDFEASNKTGFGGESVINIDEDQHPINIQRRDEFNSANNDENRKKDFFSFLGFKSTGRSMNKELEKLASVLRRSGYPEVSNEITKTALPAMLLGYPIKYWLIGGGAAALSGAGGGVWDWSTNNSDLLNRIGADQENSVQEIYEKYKLYLRNYDLVYGLGEWPKGNHADGLKLVEKLQKKFDKGQKITESEFEKMCDDITEDDINFFDDEAFFVNAHNEIVKLKGMAMEADKKRSKDPDVKLEHQYTMGDEYISKEKKKREEKLSKEEQEKRDKQKEDALANAQIVETWYDEISNQVLGRDDFGRIQVQDPVDFSFSFIDGYPGAGWKKSFDKENRLWRASKRYRVIQYEESPGSGEFVNFPFQGSGSKSASTGVNVKMIKKSISKRDRIIKHASKLTKDELAWLNYGSNPRKSKGEIKSPSVLQAMIDGPAAVSALWQKTIPQMRAHETAYNSANSKFWSSVRYDPGLGAGSLEGKLLSSDLRDQLTKSYRWWNITQSTDLSQGKMKKVVRDALDRNNIPRAGKGGLSIFDIKKSNFSHLNAMKAQQDSWKKNYSFYLDAYWAVKLVGGSTGTGSIGSGKKGVPKKPIGTPMQIYVGADAAAGVKRFEDEAPTKGYDKPFYWACTDKNARQCTTFALLGSGETGKGMPVGWGVIDNKPVLSKREGGTWFIWVNNSWQPASPEKKSNLSIRKRRLVKSGMKKISIREKRLNKLAYTPPTVVGGNTGKKKPPVGGGGGGGGGGCPVGVRPEVKGLKSKFCAPNEALAAQTLLKKYKDLGKVDGNWGSCSHSAWLYFIDDLESQGKKSKDYANRIENYTTPLRSQKVTLNVVQKAVKAYESLGGTTPGAAGSTVSDFDDLKRQVTEEKEGKIFTNDLLTKYLLGDYDKKALRSSGKVFELIKRHGERLLKTPKPRRNEKQKPSQVSKYPQQVRDEFFDLYQTKDDNATVQSLGWDWSFLQYKSGRGPYILTRIISGPETRKEVIQSLKKDVCDIELGQPGVCNKDLLDDLSYQESRRTGIDIDAERAALDKKNQEDDSKANAKAQDDLQKLSKQLFEIDDRMNEVLIQLQEEDFEYIASNGALIRQSEDMADMIRENSDEGKIEALLPKIITAASESFREKLYSNTSLLNKIYAIFRDKYDKTKGSPQEFVDNRIAKIEEAIKNAHRGMDSWRAGYVMEAILKSSDKDLLGETDASWFFGIGGDTRKEILNEYRRQSSNPRNKMTSSELEALRKRRRR